MLTRAEIERTLQAYFSDKRVKRAWLFGSWARGEADELSDVDVLVELDYQHLDPFDYFHFSDELSRRLGQKVEVLSSNGLRPRVKNAIETDKVLVYATLEAA